MDKFNSLITHGQDFIFGCLTFIADHPATFFVGLAGAGAISFTTQYAKYLIKFYTRIQKSHWFLLLTAIITGFGSIITYVATNVRMDDIKFSSWLTATFTAVIFLYRFVVIPVNNFLASYQLIKKPLEDKVKEIVELAQNQEETTSVISTSDNGNDSVVTTIEPPVETQKTADF